MSDERIGLALERIAACLEQTAKEQEGSAASTQALIEAIQSIKRDNDSAIAHIRTVCEDYNANQMVLLKRLEHLERWASRAHEVQEEILQ